MRKVLGFAIITLILLQCAPVVVVYTEASESRDISSSMFKTSVDLLDIYKEVTFFEILYNFTVGKCETNDQKIQPECTSEGMVVCGVLLEYEHFPHKEEEPCYELSEQWKKANH